MSIITSKYIPGKKLTLQEYYDTDEDPNTGPVRLDSLFSTSQQPDNPICKREKQSQVKCVFNVKPKVKNQRYTAKVPKQKTGEKP